MNLLLAAAKMRAGRPVNAAPGPATLVAGNAEWGYYGEHPDLISQADLSAAVGITVGTPLNQQPGWLKFSAKGKTLFVAKKPLRYGVSWYDLYIKGAVFGSDDMGETPPLTKAPVVQNKRVTIDGLVYKVRLLRGFDVGRPARSQGRFDSTTANGEFARLILPVLAEMQSGQMSDDWANFSYADLGMVNSGARTLVQEASVSNDSTGESWRWYMGRSLEHDYVYYMPMSAREPGYGWRPVLELVE